MSATASLRRVHRVIGIAAAVFLLSSAVTGLLWAYAPFLYWKSGYLEKKTPVASPALEAVSVDVHAVMRTARDVVGPAATLVGMALRADAGRLLYEVQYRGPGVAGTVLVDGRTGEVLSPLDEPTAVAIARQYVRGTPPVKDVARLDDYVSRTGARAVPVYRVTFDRPDEPEIVVHRDTGRIVEEQDRTRRLHFFVMRLHQLDFLGFKKTLTIVPGVALLVMVASGLALWLRPLFQRARRRHALGAAGGTPVSYAGSFLGRRGRE